MQSTYKVIIEVRGIQTTGQIETHKVFDHIELNDLTGEDHAMVMDFASETVAVLLTHLAQSLGPAASDAPPAPSV